MALRETLNRISKMDAPTSERSTIRQIILPILSALGWDVDNSNETHEVRDEYQMSPLKGSGRVDIALMGKRGQCACLVEAKAPGVNLNDYVMQLFKYDASNESGTICVLTDGLEWRLYLPREKGNPEERQFARLRLGEDPVERIADHLEKFLSRSAVVSGEAEQEAAKTLKQLQEKSVINRRLPEIWHQMLTEPDEVLVDQVKNRVRADLGFSPSADQVAQFLAVAITPNRSDSSVGAAKFRSNDEGARKTLTKEKPPTAATFLEVKENLRSGICLLDFIAVQLYNRHGQDLLDRVSKSQISRDRTTLGRPREIGIPGIFIERNLKILEIKARSYEWLRLFGYSDSDLQIHEE